MPWITPAEPPATVAAWRPVSSPSPPASQPIRATRLVADEGVEDADRVGAAADAGDDGVGQPAGRPLHLLPRLDPDDPLEVADHHRERVRPHHRADAVVRGRHAGHPVAERLVDGVLERPAAGRHRDDLGAEHPHPGHVQRLPPGVLLAHVDDALQAEQRGRGRGGHAVLAGAGLGDDPGLAHPLGQQRLAEDIVDLVRAGVGQVLALEEHPAAAGRGGEPRHLGQQRRPARVPGGQRGQLGLEAGVGLGALVGLRSARPAPTSAPRAPAARRTGRSGPWHRAAASPPGWGHGRGRAAGVRHVMVLGGRLRRVVVGVPAARSPRSAGCSPAVTRSATAERGSLPVTRLSPTSTASAPAAA